MVTFNGLQFSFLHSPLTADYNVGGVEGNGGTTNS